jgi:hypothetical protein
MKRALIFAGLCLPPPAAAQTPTIAAPKAGQVVSSPVTIVVGADTASAMDGMPAMPGMPGMDPMPGHHGAHLHILIDVPPPAPGKPIPMDSHHLHLMHGETSKTIALPPGHHRIQLLAGNSGHMAGGASSQSAPVDFIVR